MHDIALIRSDPAGFDAGLARRGLAPASSQVLALDAKRRTVQTALQALLQRRNEASRAIGQARGKGADTTDLEDEVSEIKRRIPDMELEERTFGDELQALLAMLPNLPAADVPDGPDETANIELRRVGEPPHFDFAPKDHVALGEALGLMDFDTATRLSGARFVVLKGALARLERALAQFMLDMHTGEFGYTEVAPPLLVRDETLFGTGQLPKFADDQFRTTTGLWLIPTAEVPLTNLAGDQIIDGASLPLRYTAYTPCFRSEAGAAGRDTRGMIRQHQFPKVELVSLCRPDQSDAEHARMTGIAEEVLKRLGLAFRTVALCAGDMGFGSRRTYDIEVWLPGQKTYREISSCSTCGDFQARRMRTRWREAGSKQTQFVHTLNGSALAVGRTLIAIVENYQTADGSIALPPALRPYMGGLEMLRRV
ncbi:MAG TPA: serine--tRNA ligase [Candidatus Sulfotelmatobacter sp.]|nr:serine--tRNA ligase [Candidatus Sulfotelmatobacter sp.]